MVILFDNHSILKIFLLIVKQCSSFLAKRMELLVQNVLQM